MGESNEGLENNRGFDELLAFARGSYQASTESKIVDDEAESKIRKIVEAALDEGGRELRELGEELLQGEGGDEPMSKEMKELYDQLAEKRKQASQYESRVAALTDKVRQETETIELEVENLKALQKQMTNDPLMRIATYGDQPVWRKAMLAFSLLLFIRSGADVMTSLVTGTSLNGFADGGQLAGSVVMLGAYLML